jgi:4a-hydroxytetrahydrobiopterin dehydratase
MIAPATRRLDEIEIAVELARLKGWSRDGETISKTYHFANYHQTIAFVNASAWVSHREDHHPDIVVGYNSCKVSYVTHSVGGLSQNDFICAAKLDALFSL